VIRLLLGTKNEGKLEEIRELMSDLSDIELLTFLECPFADVEETGTTFLDNALLKAQGAARETGLPTLAEDAGLEVVALGGAPGVRSARFSGVPVDVQRNNDLLLAKLRGIADRRARFITVAALYLPDGQTFVCTGTLPGRIVEEPAGSGGFGYDPLFVPDGFSRTLAEMSVKEKNRISHRRRAIGRMRLILRDLIDTGDLAA
jgi:XTP/dITP diphosphohydrolase